MPIIVEGVVCSKMACLQLQSGTFLQTNFTTARWRYLLWHTRKIHVIVKRQLSASHFSQEFSSSCRKLKTMVVVSRCRGRSSEIFLVSLTVKVSAPYQSTLYVYFHMCQFLHKMYSLLIAWGVWLQHSAMLCNKLLSLLSFVWRVGQIKKTITTATPSSGMIRVWIPP